MPHSSRSSNISINPIRRLVDMNNSESIPIPYFKKSPSRPPLSVQLAIIILFSLSSLSIFIDWWTQSRIYTFRYPWTISSPTASNSRSTSWKTLSKSYLGLPACDPFSKPGSIAYNHTFYHDTNWIPFSPTCPPSPDYLSALRALSNVPISLPLDQRNQVIHRPIQPRESSMLNFNKNFNRSKFDVLGRPYPDLDFLRGKTILVLGDSVDRNALEHLHELVDARVRSFSYTDINNDPPEGWDPRSTPWEVNLGLLNPRNYNDSSSSNDDHHSEFAGLNCKFINGFFYGLDDIDEFSVQGDWHAPGLAEDRVRTLYEPMTQAFAQEDGEGPAFITLQSGLWDLAFFGRRNRGANQTTDEPLTTEQLEWWQKRFRSLVKTIKHTWPNTPIWIRTTHRVGKQFWAAHDWQNGLKYGLGKGFVNFFPDHRVHQIHQMQLFLAKEEGLPIFDFHNIWEGYQKYQDKVHPLKNPGGVIINQALIHHIWMESIGRENWDPNFLKQNPIGKLPHSLNQFY